MIETGGPAFPSIQLDDRGEAIVPAQEGMSLRDYFAAKVSAGIISARIESDSGESCIVYMGDQGPCWNDSLRSAGRIAEMAYEVADAMLAARKAAPQ